MLRLFRRPPRDSFDLDAEEAAAPVGGEDLADGELGPSTGRQRRPLKTILAFGIVAVGLGALYLSWSGGGSNEPVPPRLLPQGPPPAQRGQQPLGPPTAASALQVSPSTATAPTPSPSAPPTQQAAPPTFYVPLQHDPRETAQVVAGRASGPATGPFNVLAQASHEATVENLRSQIAELKRKKLKAELEADELRKNPRRLFKDEKPAAEPKKEPSPLERLARVPPPTLPIPGPILAERQAQLPAPQPAAPPAPPQMRVRMVTLDPKDSLIEAGEGDSRGWFKVQEGQKFPDFVVTTIGEAGVTISLAGRGFFNPVGGYALGAPQGNRQAGSRQTFEPARR
jgi:hypothetical protein